jgi:hypothetical protein
MQYYAVYYVDASAVRRYIVKANDHRQVEQRSLAQYMSDPERPVDAPLGKRGRVADLTPKQVNGEFMPRIDGKLVPGGPLATRDLAVTAAVEFLDNQGAK